VRSIYTWVVFVHVLAAFGFVFAHGTTAFVAFRVRGEREPQRLVALLDLSTLSTGLMYWSLAALVAAGVAAGIMGGWFGQLWIWSALAVLVAVAIAMFALGSQYYNRVRHALGQRAWGREAPDPPPATPAELARLLDSRRPEAITAVGGAALVLLIWLMVFKPF